MGGAMGRLAEVGGRDAAMVLPRAGAPVTVLVLFEVPDLAVWTVKEKKINTSRTCANCTTMPPL